MSYRDENMTFLDLIRDMKRRIKALEDGGARAKRNDIRLRDMVVSTDSVNNKLLLKNTLNNQTHAIGFGDEDACWSYSGLLSEMEVGDECAPPHVVARNETAIEIVLAMRTASEGIVVTGHFNKGTVTVEATLPVGQTVWVTPINIKVARNSTIWFCAESFGSNDRDLSVFVRFGTPTADFTTSLT